MGCLEGSLKKATPVPVPVGNVAGLGSLVNVSPERL